MKSVVITGVGLCTPLGNDPKGILDRIRQGERAAAPPRRFDAAPFPCPVCAEVSGFDPREFIGDIKTIRLMGGDALFAAAAARLAMKDAGIAVGTDYRPEEIALFGATGMAGIQLEEVAPLIRHSAAPDGSFDAARFGAEALKRVRPILSFKILSNMPICFVSIFEELRGPNAVYNPWEGQGARAIGRGVQAVRRGEASCALVGGCDVKTHELAFLSLERQGVFRSWREEGRGTVPGEGGAFLVLEREERAIQRHGTIYARIRGMSFRTARGNGRKCEVYRDVLTKFSPLSDPALVSGEEGDFHIRCAEDEALDGSGIQIGETVRPKLHLGNLFAGAAAVQVGLAAVMARSGGEVVANCFGHGSEQASFHLEGL